ncbi:hypothetical protein FB645_004311 [Coemansia sp. IMI 203386]|nr:hypothetical protein FB645_004311 [Coemansia sp. IMI 203386]
MASALPTDSAPEYLAPWMAKREMTQETRDKYIVAITGLVGFLVAIKVVKFIFASITFIIDMVS